MENFDSDKKAWEDTRDMKWAEKNEAVAQAQTQLGGSVGALLSNRQRDRKGLFIYYVISPRGEGVMGV